MQQQIEAAGEQLILVFLLFPEELFEEGKEHVVGGELLPFELLVVPLHLEVAMPLGDDHGGLEEGVEL